MMRPFRLASKTLARLPVALMVVLAVAFLAQPAQAQPQELPLGSPLPMADAEMKQSSGGTATLASLAGEQGTVLLFWSNQCPWVSKYEDRVRSLIQDHQNRGIQFVLVNANDAAAFPQESAEASRAKGYPVPYLMDEGSRLANALGASRTPHVFVFDANQTLVYIGSIDDSPGDPGNVQRNYLRDALQALAGGQDVPVPSTKAFGCMIKYYQ